MENTDNMFNDNINYLNTIYNDLSYFDLYSGSLFIFILLTIIIFLVHAYSIVMSKTQEIKSDWINQRCNPQVIPFAGFINKPDNSTIVEFTNDNFQYCIQDILKNITGYFLEPFNYITSALTDVYNDINESINAIRQFISNLRDDITNVTKDVMSRILNIMTPLQIILISIKDTYGKIQGILTAGLMTALGSYLTLQSLMGSILEFIVLILIALSVVIIGLWLSLFSWPLAAATTVIFLSISIPLAIIIVFMTDVLKIHMSHSIPNVPKKPKSCFDENTIILLNDGSTKKIKNINIGDIIVNNNKVKSVLKLDATSEIVYELNGVIVSGSHIVYYNDKWLRVSEHPLSKKIHYDKKYLYCLNTTNKTILINKTLFSDWDELYELQTQKKILNILNVRRNYNKIYSIENINDYLDGGFPEDTLILMKNKKSKCIKDIELGDVLFEGEVVCGLVQLDTTSYKNDEKFNFSYTKNGEYIKIKPIFNDTNKKSSIYYHLITDIGTFSTTEHNFFDYNYHVSILLDD